MRSRTGGGGGGGGEGEGGGAKHNQKPYTAARNWTLPQLGSYMHKKGSLLQLERSSLFSIVV